jgi:outer membrane protein TolC
MTSLHERATPRTGRSVGLICLAASLLAGCATADEDGAFANVQTLVSERTRTAVTWHRDAASREAVDFRVRQMRAEPLHVDGAVELAFLRNPAIQAKLAGIGIAEADVAQAGRMANPVVSISRIAAGGAVEIERQFLFSLVSLFTIGPRTRIARDQAERTRYVTALDIVTAADGVKRAWIEAVAARERVGQMEKVRDSAGAAGDLAQRMADVGSMTPIDQARIKAFEAEVAAQLARLRTAEATSRERLIRQLGVWGDETGFVLPSRLTPLPKRAKRLRDIERLALARRLDVRAAHKEVEVLAKTVDLTAFTGVVSLLEVSGYANKEVEVEDDGKTRHYPKGFEVEFAVPIFDPGDAKVSRAKWTYLKAVEELRALAVSARSEVREAYVAYRGAYDLARHYSDAVLPLNKRITEEELLRYNGMLTGVFELLAATRQEAEAAMAALDAKRDFWLADARLDSALLSGGSSTAASDADVAISLPGSGAEH